MVNNKTQTNIFTDITDEVDVVEYLSECPWLYGEYANKLWRHSLHAVSSYPSKLRPQIAYFFVEMLSETGNVVLDPFCGSGTVCLEACLNGRVGVGTDLSPYAYILTDFKTAPPDRKGLTERISQLEGYLDKPLEEEIPDEVAEFFHEDTLREIVNFKNRLDFNSHIDRCLLAALCGILHGGRPGFLSRRTRDIIPLKPKGPSEYKPLIPRLVKKTERIFSSRIPHNFVIGQAYQADSRDLGFIEDDSVDIVITSPPFFETTEFVRHNWLRLWLIGWDINRQQEKAAEFVGERNINSFYKDLLTVIAECERVVKGNGYIIVHGGKKNGESMTEKLVDFADTRGHSIEAVIDEGVDHSRKHKLRKHSGHSHNFVIIKTKK
jgi:SAM-dependent methyltransferase